MDPEQERRSADLIRLLDETFPVRGPFRPTGLGAGSPFFGGLFPTPSQDEWTRAARSLADMIKTGGLADERVQAVFQRYDMHRAALVSSRFPVTPFASLLQRLVLQERTAPDTGSTVLTRP